MDFNRVVAGVILRNKENIKVDLHHPNANFQIEIREEGTYVFLDKFKGLGGYPLGIGGKALALLSGGIDSPVACFYMMKRGVALETIHFASFPYTSKAAEEKVYDILDKLNVIQPSITLHIVPFTKLQEEIYKHVDESYAITIMRRMMVRIASAWAKKRNCLALVTGESVGQVASQTLDSMSVINEVVKTPVIRPCVTMDKLEIIDLANKIGTYETSILPFEDCCTIFTPKAPVTKPNLVKCEKMEARFDYDKFIDECIENMESINIYAKKKEEDDLF
jgi:thiamine biosynthesis protein ThiI